MTFGFLFCNSRYLKQTVSEKKIKKPVKKGKRKKGESRAKFEQKKKLEAK